MFQLSYRPEMMPQLLEPLFFPLVHQKTHVATVGLAKKKNKTKPPAKIPFKALVVSGLSEGVFFTFGIK